VIRTGLPDCVESPECFEKPECVENPGCVENDVKADMVAEPERPTNKITTPGLGGRIFAPDLHTADRERLTSRR
jgi:hypothetical protein